MLVLVAVQDQLPRPAVVDEVQVQGRGRSPRSVQGQPAHVVGIFHDREQPGRPGSLTVPLQRHEIVGMDIARPSELPAVAAVRLVERNEVDGQAEAALEDGFIRRAGGNIRAGVLVRVQLSRRISQP